MVNTSRNLALKLNTFIPNEKTELKKLNAELISNYSFSMKNHLRDKVIIEEIKYNKSLSKEEYTESDHKPNLIAKKLYLETKKTIRQQTHFWEHLHYR